MSKATHTITTPNTDAKLIALCAEFEQRPLGGLELLQLMSPEIQILVGRLFEELFPLTPQSAQLLKARSISLKNRLHSDQCGSLCLR